LPPLPPVAEFPDADHPAYEQVHEEEDHAAPILRTPTKPRSGFPTPTGSRFLFIAITLRRPDTQVAFSVRPRAAEAVAKCLSFLAGLELGEDLPCGTVDDDEWLQGVPRAS
jgi:hypothetical protein